MNARPFGYQDLTFSCLFISVGSVSGLDPKAVDIHSSLNTYTWLIWIFNHWKLFSNSTIGTLNIGILWMKHFKSACAVIILHSAAFSLDNRSVHPVTKSTYYCMGNFLAYKTLKILSIITEMKFKPIPQFANTEMKIVKIQHLKTLIWSCFKYKKVNATWTNHEQHLWKVNVIS